MVTVDHLFSNVVDQEKGNTIVNYYGSSSSETLYLHRNNVLGFMGLAQLSYSNKSQENLKSPYKWMAKG
jgi:hypothetical protein